VVELDAELATDRLTIATTLRPTTDVPVPIAFGFHPYVRIPGVAREEWLVSLPSRRHLGLDARSIPTGAADPEPPARFRLGVRAFDDAYDGLADGARFSVTGGGRTLTVVLESGYPAGQVFAPPSSSFICFEPMTAPTNALRSGAGLRRIMPGGAFTAVFSIHVA
jgi:galactose mutarotase-like enzyme